MKMAFEEMTSEEVTLEEVTLEEVAVEEVAAQVAEEVEELAAQVAVTARAGCSRTAWTTTISTLHTAPHHRHLSGSAAAVSGAHQRREQRREATYVPMMDAITRRWMHVAQHAMRRSAGVTFGLTQSADVTSTVRGYAPARIAALLPWLQHRHRPASHQHRHRPVALASHLASHQARHHHQCRHQRLHRRGIHHQCAVACSVGHCGSQAPCTSCTASLAS